MTTTTTPQKIYKRFENGESLCRICGNDFDKRHLYRIFTKSGQEKQLQHKILVTCGVEVKECDVVTKSICRKCEQFISKIFVFQENCKNTQEILKKQLSVKRMASTDNVENNNTNARKRLALHDVTNTAPPQNSSQSNKINQKVESIYHPSFDSIVTKSITKIEENKIKLALNTEQPLAIASTIYSIDSIKIAFQSLLIKQCERSCEKLCSRKENKSLLLDNSYEGIKEFSFKPLWNEVIKHHPLLADLFMTMTKQRCHPNNASEEIIVKGCFVYSIIMHSRWHELSLMQRLNTVLIIEGGCSKQV